MEGFDPIVDLPPNGYLTSFYSGNVSGSRLVELVSLVEDRNVDVGPERAFQLDQMVEAHRFLEGSQCFGKIVVTE